MDLKFKLVMGILLVGSLIGTAVLLQEKPVEQVKPVDPGWGYTGKPADPDDSLYVQPGRTWADPSRQAAVSRQPAQPGGAAEAHPARSARHGDP